jgi:WD40 repeat protein
MTSDVSLRGLVRSTGTVACFALAACVAVTTATSATASGAGTYAGPLGGRIVLVGFAPYHAVVSLDPHTGKTTAITPQRFPPEVFGADSLGLRPEVAPASVAVSPDGGRVVFATDQSNYDCCGRRPWDGELYSIAADGSDMRRLTDTPNRDESSPVYSPDGRRIAFLSDLAIGQADTPRVSLAVMDSTGSDIRYLSAAKAGLSAASMTISWHRDSRRLLFFDGGTDTSLQGKTLLVDVATGARRTLHGSAGRFSRDGRVALEWGSDIYVGTPDQLAKPLFARTLKPRVASQWTGTGRRSLITSFTWLPDGRLLYKGNDVRTTGCQPGEDAGPWIGVASRSGKPKMIWRARCFWNLAVLSPSPSGADVALDAGRGMTLRGMLLRIATGRVTEVYGGDFRSAVWGWQPTWDHSS